jgi:quercetin dioxygenase-like cupin family protein
MFVFDLEQLAKFREKAPAVQVLARSGHVRYILFSFKAGQELKEHTTSSQIAVQAVSGRLRFATQEKESELLPGQIILLEAEVPHSVYAETDCVMLLTMTPDPHHHSLEAELFDKIKPMVELN